jgi:hypothetical protein
MRTLKGVFVKKNYRLPDEFIGKFDLTIPGCANYVEFLRTLRGAEALLEVMSFGAYSHHFTVKYEVFLNGEAKKEIKYSLSKLNARIGLCLTSSIPFGRDWKVRKIGEIRFVWDKDNYDVVADMFCAQKNESGNPLYSEEEIKEMYDKVWKDTKSDGMTIVRESKVRKQFKKLYGKNLKPEDLIGKLLQYRWAGVKGTAFVAADSWMDQCTTPSGEYVYKGYDLIVENNSWKSGPTEEFYTGDIAPEFEFVAISKQKHSSNLTYQFIAALDGDVKNPEAMVQVLKKKVDANFDKIQNMLKDPDVCKAMMGMSEAGGPLEDFGIDELEMSQKSKASKVLAICDRIIHDPWFRAKVLDLFSKLEEEERMGKIVLEKAANRYIITDPTAFFRTDLMDENYNILITDPAQVALGALTHVHWTGKSGEAVLFRSPCVSPGEPQRVDMQPLEAIPEFITTAYGKIPARKMFGYAKDLVIISGFSIILDALGGADTDGDTALIVYDEDIVKLRSRNRKTLLVKLPGGDKKDVVTIQSIKQNMVDSLKNNGIGLITDFATTWRDIQLHCMANRKVDKGLADALTVVKEFAAQNLETGADWVDDDPSLVAIAAMDVKDWKSVAFTACNAALKQLRVLQEMAINTAKSGVWVEFGCEDPDKNNYKHLGIWIRASWHRDKAKTQYKSTSPMGQVAQYVKDKWAELEAWAKDTAAPVLFSDQMDLGERYEKAFGAANSLRKMYGSTVHEWRRSVYREEMTEDAFKANFDRLTTEIHSQLTALAIEYGVDAVAAAAYDASNTKDADKDGNGTSFVWNCFFEELVDVLQYLENGGTTNKMVRVFVDPEYTFTAVSDTEVSIIDRRVSYKGLEMATAVVDDGNYIMKNIKGNPYICVPIPRRTIDELNASMAGTSTAIIGITRQKDANGAELDRPTAVHYLVNLGQCIIRTDLKKFDEYPVPRVVCNARIAPNVWIPIGTLPAVDKPIVKALANKLFRVRLSKDAYKDSSKRIGIDIVEMLKDLNAPAK